MENDAKKKRVALACNNCRLKKYKCNGIQPVCNSCAKQSLDCVWTPKSTAPPTEKKKGPRARYIASLKEKIKTLEELARNLNLNIYQQKPASRLTCLDDDLGDCYEGEQSPSGPHDSPVSEHGTPSLTTHSLMTDVESIEYPPEAVDELPMVYQDLLISCDS
ncbi:hypothetical protein HK098_002337 [Nowakowskiella sp. JEL0407]|nr:hypothetical protein HK098_002337 [Nowakowskiella sp. JEL0407]